MLSLAAAAMLPRVAADGQSGLAAAGTAAMVFFACVSVTLGVALYLLVVALRFRRELSLGARLAGFAPIPMLVVAGFAVWYFGIRDSTGTVAPYEPPRPVTAPSNGVLLGWGISDLQPRAWAS